MNRHKGVLALVAGLAGLALLRSEARRRRAFMFRGRVVVITGGSRGLGLALARQFATEGATLVLVARDADELERAREALREYEVEVMTLVCDVTRRAEVERMVARVQERFGNIDVLVNNAGIIQVGPMEMMTLADYEEAMQVHYWAPLYTSLAVLPQMRRRRVGRIVNISSIGGKVSVPHLLPYSASKFALVGLSEGMRSELVRDNIHVTTVCPGLIRSGSHVNAHFKGQNQAEYAWFTLSNASPVTSIDVQTAAKQIVNACRYGDAELVISLPAQILNLFHSNFPSMTADILGIANRLLPATGGIGTAQATGRESQSSIAPSLFTAPSDMAISPNNE